MQYIAENATNMEGREKEKIDKAQSEYRVITADTHRSDRAKKARNHLKQIATLQLQQEISSLFCKECRGGNYGLVGIRKYYTPIKI